MLAKIMKWTSVFVLIVAIFFWMPADNYAVLLQFVICGSAVLVAIEAARLGKHLWRAPLAELHSCLIRC